MPLGQAHGVGARLPALLALLGVGIAYTFLPAALRPLGGPPWLLLAILAALAVPIVITRRRGHFHITRRLGLAAAGLSAAAVAFSAGALLQRLLGGQLAAGELLQDAALVWTANVVVFALLHWELDGGGHALRVPGPNVSSDFVFPQQLMVGRQDPGGDPGPAWAPTFVDYLFLAFNTSTAFSPTDTLVLARRAKLLMMAQSLVSLTTIAVLAARAINTLPA